MNYYYGRAGVLPQPGEQGKQIRACTVTSSAVGGFVGDEQFGPQGEGHGQHDASAHPAGELVAR